MSSDNDLPPEQKVKILLVDDKPQNLTALEAVLDGLGQELVKASSGPEALRQILVDDFAAILLDVRMPGMDGFETAALIRQRDRSRSTPIIFLTAHKNDEQLFRGYDMGAVDYLVKPIVPEVLRSKVSVFVELSKKTQFLRKHAELLEHQNTELERAIARRKQAEEEVKRLNQHLEERLAELKMVNQELETLYGKVKDLDQLKTEFFANISHELRTPLALMLGPTEKLLSDGGLTAEQRQGLETVERSTHILLKHVNDLLDISKLDAGKMRLSYAETDLTQLVLVSAANFDALARERGISFSVDAPPHLPAQVDPERIQRVLLNLLSNAFKFVPDGGQVTCQLSGADAWARISIQDNGPGIPPELRQAVFERFRQGDPSSARRFGGSGLGLSIVRELVELHGGSVAVYDAPGGGALFRVEVPLAAPVGTEVQGHAPEPAESEPMTRYVMEELRMSCETRLEPPPEPKVSAENAPLLLIVEDNRAMNRFLVDSLGEAYRVETAFDGEEGLQKALALRPDLILTDLMMPRMSGEQMVRAIRSLPELDSIPIVLLTAKADRQLCASLLREGAQDYLTKPFSLAEMLARVRNQVTMKRVRSVLQKEIRSRTQNLEEMAKEVSRLKREAQAALSAAEAANRAKDEFLATVSHEMRTPLTALVGWARLLRAGTLDAETSARALETIERNARAQAKLIEDLLDTARIITGKLRLDVRPLDLAPIIEGAIDAVRPAADANSIRLFTTLDGEVGPVSGDPDRLQQVIWNLLSNAVKFTPNGGRVDVRLERAGSQVQITVRDTGKGISPGFLPHVFERFRQADSSSTRAYGGLGLGLAIVRHLVEMHGGSVQADSPGEEQGATFTVRLPLVNASFPGELTTREPSSGRDQCLFESTPALEGLHVLVLDDEADTRDLLGTVLKKCGARVTALGSVAEAIETVQRARPDVMLCDIQLPGQDGYSFIRHVRSLETQWGGFIPAAALTGYVENQAQSLSAGFQVQLGKPIDPVELVAAVANLAGRRVAAESLKRR